LWRSCASWVFLSADSPHAGGLCPVLMCPNGAEAPASVGQLLIQKMERSDFCVSHGYMTASVLFRVSVRPLLDIVGGSIYVANFDFWGKIQKPGVRNSMTYRRPNSRKSNFATEPFGVQRISPKSRSGLDTPIFQPPGSMTAASTGRRIRPPLQTPPLKSHIPPDLVVDRRTAYIECSSALDFPLRHEAHAQDLL
jgi:hypothetical protein